MSKEEVIPGVFSLTMVSPEISRAAKPGQFVHIRCGGEGSNYILRRPFSIHRVVPGRAFEILFQVKGKGTEALSQTKLHDTLDVMGPLGTGFTYTRDIKSALLIAGGLGVAPLIFLAEELYDLQVKMFSMMGVHDKSRLLRYIDFKRMSKKAYAATDDGSFGHNGTVVDLLNRTIHQIRPQVIYACGPEKMLQKVSETADEFGVDCQVSLETTMACGFGVCLGCTCATREGYKLACKDGPVFNGHDIIWGGSGTEQFSLGGCTCETTETIDTD